MDLPRLIGEAPDPWLHLFGVEFLRIGPDAAVAGRELVGVPGQERRWQLEPALQGAAAR